MEPAANMGYDRAITIFSPDGRLFQVEYAREAVRRGTTALGVKSTEGVALIVDKRINSRLIEPESIEKIFQVDEHIGCATSGLVADARILVDKARIEAQTNKVTYGEKIPLEVLAKKICDFKQAYTQYGGVRPFGTSLLLTGVDDSGVYLFETDPSGALTSYKADAIGVGRNAVMEIFEAQYKEDMSLDDVINLGLEALKGANEGKLDPATIEIGTISVKEMKFVKLSYDEVAGYVDDIAKRNK